MLRLPHNLHQIWRLVLRQNLTCSNLIILLLAIVFPLTTISHLFPVASCIHLKRNGPDTSAAACLWTTQGARYSIFHNIPTMLVKQYNVPSTSNQLHGIKSSKSKRTIWIMGFLLLPTSRSIVSNSNKSFHSVGWVPSIIMGLLNGT